MLEEQNKDMPVDAVITWVDGNDTNWQAKLNEHAEIKIDFEEKEQSLRYNSIGEIDYAIKSILKYASFVRTIFLVTDDQIPASFDQLKMLAKEKDINLTIIDHTVIFRGYEEYLPCFNSRSIATVLHRIPDLSERFIIFNDDTFLMRSTEVHDYFVNQYPVLRGDWKKFYEDQLFRKLYYSSRSLLGISNKKDKVGFKKAMQLSAKLAGTSKYIRRFHTPIPMRKSVISDFFRTTDLLRENIKYKFRNEDQFLVESLSNHLEIKNETYVYLKDTQLVYFRSYKNPKDVRLKLERSLKDEKKLFVTFQSLEMADPDTLAYIFKWLDNQIHE